jgi:lysine 6-dehydrogenase
MKYKALVLGAGKMAKPIAYDLVKQKFISQVTIASRSLRDAKHLKSMLKNEKIKATTLDLKDDKNVLKLMKDHDCAISAVPYNFNYMLAKLAVQGGCHFVDLGGNNDIVKKEFSLSSEAKKSGVAIVPDSGLAPGLVSNLTALGMQELKNVQSVKLRVGGLPQHPKPPLNYMIVFSVNGLINEYIEPALVIENGKIKKIKSMGNLEQISFPKYGKLEAFTTSGGTSTLPQSFKGKIKELNYKTIRYSGHAEKMKVLLGLARPKLHKLLLNKLSIKDKDLVLLKVILENKKQRLTYTLIDKEKRGLSAMMRCTGFPAAVIAEMILLGEITKKGTLKHEFDIPSEILIRKLRKRGLDIKRRLTKIKK